MCHLVCDFNKIPRIFLTWSMAAITMVGDLKLVQTDFSSFEATPVFIEIF